MVSNLLTIRRMASLLGVAEEDVSLALMIPPVVRPTSRADEIRVFDREAFDIVRHRLETLALDTGNEEVDRRIHQLKEEASKRGFALKTGKELEQEHEAAEGQGGAK